MPDVRLVHSPRIWGIVEHFRNKQPPFRILLAVYLIAFYKPRFRADNHPLFAVVEYNILRYGGVFFYWQNNRFRGVSRDAERRGRSLEHDFFTPVYRNVATLFYCLRFELVSRFVVNFYIRTVF